MSMDECSRIYDGRGLFCEGKYANLYQPSDINNMIIPLFLLLTPMCCSMTVSFSQGIGGSVACLFVFCVCSRKGGGEASSRRAPSADADTVSISRCNRTAVSIRKRRRRDLRQNTNKYPQP